jgi:NarL family two-component system response regulator YdfI
VIRVFIVARGALKERLEELIESCDAAIVGWADDLEGLDEELVAEAEIVVLSSAGDLKEELLDSVHEAATLREVPVVLLSDHVPSLNWLNRAMRAGIRGVLPLEIAEEKLTAALAAVSSGLVVIHPREVTARAGNTGGESLELTEPLTVREKQVLQMLSEGLGNKEIGARLKISEHTAKFHVASILGKLGASTRTEAVSIGMRRGLILV